MKKIIFMCINMNIGGTEKALLNMINEIPRDEYEVTILMLEESGGFLSFIPDWVNVKYIENFDKIRDVLNQPPIKLVKCYIKKLKFISSFNIVLLHIISKFMGERSLYFKWVLRKYPNISEVYDIAVAYAGPMDFITYFVSDKIASTKKIQWIHFDITKISFNSKFANKFYNKYDKILAVSEEAKQKLIMKCPSLSFKTEVFYNVISPKSIEKLSNLGEGFKDHFEGIRILTVGRLSQEKGQDLAIKALYRLIKDGYKVRWYCIGDGVYKKKYEEIIKEYGLEEHFILLGSSINPYKYMKECDIYVQPSRHEGYCITLGEARCFNNPIVTTNFTGSREQIEHETNGLVCEVSDIALYNSIKQLLDNSHMYNKIKNNLSIHNLDN